jgi:hypothetical protein
MSPYYAQQTFERWDRSGCRNAVHHDIRCFITEAFESGPCAPGEFGLEDTHRLLSSNFFSLLTLRKQSKGTLRLLSTINMKSVIIDTTLSPLMRIADHVSPICQAFRLHPCSRSPTFLSFSTLSFHQVFASYNG